MIDFITPACLVCQKTSVISISSEKLQRWISGEHIQNVWPDQNVHWREIMMTGTHPHCWNKLWPGWEQEDPEEE